jgi:hypothetical protein
LCQGEEKEMVPSWLELLLVTQFSIPYAPTILAQAKMSVTYSSLIVRKNQLPSATTVDQIITQVTE